MEVKITTQNIESYKNGELPLVVDLWATWCGPCQSLQKSMTARLLSANAMSKRMMM